MFSSPHATRHAPQTLRVQFLPNTLQSPHNHPRFDLIILFTIVATIVLVAVVAVAAIGLVSAGALLGWALGASGEPADDMTSFELRAMARRLGWPEIVQRGVHGVMTTVDRIRFGRVPSDESELRKVLLTATETARAIDAMLKADLEDATVEAAG